MTRNKRNLKIKQISTDLYPSMVNIRYSADSILDKSHTISISEKIKNIVTIEFNKILYDGLK